MFSTTSEYALRAMTYLAGETDAANSETISTNTKIPKPFLSKILRDLVVAGLVHGQRGPNGGFTLARRATDISVLDVINAVDPLKRIDECPLGLPEHKKLCPLHAQLDSAIEQVECTLRKTKMIDLLEKPIKPKRRLKCDGV